jgi:hypothetical protein
MHTERMDSDWKRGGREGKRGGGPCEESEGESAILITQVVCWDSGPAKAVSDSLLSVRGLARKLRTDRSNARCGELGKAE